MTVLLLLRCCRQQWHAGRSVGKVAVLLHDEMRAVVAAIPRADHLTSDNIGSAAAAMYPACCRQNCQTGRQLDSSTTEVFGTQHHHRRPF